MITQKNLTQEQYKDLEEFLKDLASSKRRMNIPSLDKTILGRVIDSLPTGVDLLQKMWGEAGIPENYITDLIDTLVANIEADKYIEQAKETGNILLALSALIGIEERLLAIRSIFVKYLKEGVEWWLSHNLINNGE